MADGKSVKVLKKVVEGEHLAANALAVAAGKVKESDLQKLLGKLSDKHEANAEVAGTKLQAMGGKYPVPGLRDQLKKGWETVATSKTTADALKILQKQERDSVAGYKNLLGKVKDEQVMSLVLRNMADTSQHVAELSEKLGELKAKKAKKGRILGLPWFFWVVAAAGGGFAYVRSRMQSNSPAEPTSPTTPAGDSNKA